MKFVTPLTRKVVISDFFDRSGAASILPVNFHTGGGIFALLIRSTKNKTRKRNTEGGAAGVSGKGGGETEKNYEKHSQATKQKVGK